ncbi:hypothetical protein [Salinimicrobium sp. WS361]|uniref:hypothetical protein n=1 Tax=Salinimicrobium sp. WS361 TaxID=3425123 RepID=UPI003D6EAD7A
MVIARNTILIAFISIFIFSCGKSEGPPVEAAFPLQEEASVTAYTVRLPGNDPETQAIILSQTVYAATREDNAVGAIILVPQDEKMAFTAMHRVTHMPVNAPMLYLDGNRKISDATFEEMKRLKPDGVMPDGRNQVYAVNVPPAEVERIRKELNYKVRTFNEEDPILLAELLDRWQAALKSDHPDEVVISAIDHEDGIKHGMGAMGWNAHMGKGFAWVYKDSIPAATKEILKRRYGDHGAYMYVTGNPDIISAKVVKELGRYGLVRRITGANVFASNTVNAGYKDYGRNFGWGWDWAARDFGWGIAQAGHNYIFSSAENVLGTIPAAVLGHMGKHGPILLVEEDSLPGAVKSYLEMVKPFQTNPQETILNFGWIIGDEQILTREVQMEIDYYLSPFPLRETQETLTDSTNANLEQ